MPSIKGRDARNPSPSFGVQELYDDNWRPQEDTDSEELSYGSSPGTSRRSSPQQILSNNLEYGRGIGGQWNGRLQNAPAIPHDTDDGPRISSSPDAGEFPRRHFDTQSEVSGAMPSLHGAPASGVTAGASSSAKHDCNLSSTRVLSGTLQGPSPSAEGVGRPANSKRKQDPRLSQLRKREIELSTKRCKCDDLHPFFAVSGLKYPNIELFPEEDMEMFLANAEKVVDCAAHDPDLVDQCLLIITEDQYHQVCFLLILRSLIREESTKWPFSIRRKVPSVLHPSTNVQFQKMTLDSQRTIILLSYVQLQLLAWPLAAVRRPHNDLQTMSAWRTCPGNQRNDGDVSQASRAQYSMGGANG